MCQVRMFHVESDLFISFFPRARLVWCFLLSVRVRLILKKYENLHVHFEDCVGRGVTNASGVFSDAFYINIQQCLYISLWFFSRTPSLRLEQDRSLVFCSTGCIKTRTNQVYINLLDLASCLISTSFTTPPLPTFFVRVYTQACDRRPSRPPAKPLVRVDNVQQPPSDTPNLAMYTMYPTRLNA